MNGRMEGWADGFMYGQTDKQIDGWMDGWADGVMVGWTDEWIDGMDGWMGE